MIRMYFILIRFAFAPKLVLFSRQNWFYLCYSRCSALCTRPSGLKEAKFKLGYFSFSLSLKMLDNFNSCYDFDHILYSFQGYTPMNLMDFCQFFSFHCFALLTLDFFLQIHRVLIRNCCIPKKIYSKFAFSISI